VTEHSDTAKAAISRGLKRYHERRRQAAQIRPRALDRLRGSGIVAPSLQPLVDIAEEEMAALVASLGGVDALSAQQRALLEDVVSVGVVLRGELSRYLTQNDAEAGVRVGSLANSRRSSLCQLGLGSKRDDPLDISAYQDAIEEARS
jgi:hypothetical protein